MKNKRILFSGILLVLILGLLAFIIFSKKEPEASAYLHVDSIPEEMKQDPKKLAEGYLTYLSTVTVTEEDIKAFADVEKFMEKLNILYQNAWHQRFTAEALDGLRTNRTAGYIYGRAIEAGCNTKLNDIKLTDEEGVENGYRFDMEVVFEDAGGKAVDTNHFKGYIRLEQGSGGWMIKSMKLEEY